MASFLNVVNSVRQEVTIENISDDIMYLSSIIEKLASEGKMCKSLSMTAYVTNFYIMRYHNTLYLHFNIHSCKSSVKGRRCRNNIPQNI